MAPQAAPTDDSHQEDTQTVTSLVGGAISVRHPPVKARRRPTVPTMNTFAYLAVALIILGVLMKLMPLATTVTMASLICAVHFGALPVPQVLKDKVAQAEGVANFKKATCFFTALNAGAGSSSALSAVASSCSQVGGPSPATGANNGLVPSELTSLVSTLRGSH